MAAEPVPPPGPSTTPGPASSLEAVLPPDVGRMTLKQKQVAYHDWESRSYEDKFSISYDQRCIDYATARFRKVVPPGAGFGDVLEVGAGTGFFLVNLALGGCLDGAALHASDISRGMLEVCAANGAAHGLDIRIRQGDAEALPFEDDRFDLVIGHAFVHHLPVPGLAFREIHRVLRPGGTLVIAGEPTYLGDRMAGVVKRATYRGWRMVTSLPHLRDLRRPSVRDADGSDADALLADLEHEVDLHTFRPRDVEHLARLTGLVEVQVVTEELTASWLGWAVRTIEGSVRPELLGSRWAYAAFNGYRALTHVDDVLARVVPKDFFYNLILRARKPYRS